MKQTTSINRRDFLRTTSLLGGGLLISFSLPAGIKHLGETAPATMFAPNAFLRIGADESVHIVLSKVEMGQGIWTTLPMLVADELDCDWSKIKVEHSPPGQAYAHTAYGVQMTGGSTSTWSEFDRYRMAGATARVMLVEAAAKKLGVSPDVCKTENGFVIAGGKRLSYGEVATDASLLSVPTVKLREPKDWKYIGKSIKRLDSPEKINGQAKYGMDVRFSDLLTALVAHSPVFGGTVKSFDGSKAKAIKGVTDVVQIPMGVAVLADNYWNAKLGRDALKIEWDLGANATIDSKLQQEEYSKLANTKGTVAQQKGDAASALLKAAKVIDVEISQPYLTHASMEPMNCTVKISADKCEIWTGTQLPMIDQGYVAAFLGMKPEQVSITTPFMGGSFGRRGSFNSDWVMEAVHIAKASGKTVKMVWSREDDICGGYYRPAYVHRAQVGLGKDGFPIAWQHRIVGQSIFTNTLFQGFLVHDGVDNSSVEGVKDSPYLNSVSDLSIELHTTTLGVPVLPLRSVGNTHTAFVMEVLIDELATEAGKDPVEYRRILLKDHPRHLAALNLVAEKAGWGKPLPKGVFHGIAVHESFGSYVAQVVELSVTEGQKIRIHRVICAIDCGVAVNPDGIRAQMEGGIVFGLTAALYGEITLENGQVKQRNFNDYKMMRINEMPLVEVHIVPSTEKMGGVGEPGVPPVAPAFANALFAATGKRVRKLPVRLENILKS